MVTHLGPELPNALLLVTFGQEQVLLDLLQAVLSRSDVELPYDSIGQIVAFGPPPETLSGASQEDRAELTDQARRVERSPAWSDRCLSVATHLIPFKHVVVEQRDQLAFRHVV